MSDKELRDIYYQPENLWIDRKALTILRKETKLPLKDVKAWLETVSYTHLTLPTILLV